MKKSDIIFDNLLFRQPKVCHGPAAGEYLRQVCGITDEDVLNAVRYHTVGRGGMSQLEKLIYVADLTSEERSYPEVDKVRALANENLDKALLEGLRFSMEKLLSREKPLALDTVNAYNECLLRLQEQQKEEPTS